MHYHGSRVDLSILDEGMLISLNETEARDLLEIIHARHKKIGEETIADAIPDRIVHDSYTIGIHGDSKDDHSMREVYGIHATSGKF